MQTVDDSYTNVWFEKIIKSKNTWSQYNKIPYMIHLCDHVNNSEGKLFTD